MNNQSPDTDIAVSLKGITKVYKLYDNPRQRFIETFHPLRKKYHRDFYALKDISLMIQKGETLGILGRNGAGKSTLLQIITGVTTPSSGSMIIHGRIAALLELGTGFNPEFTGIENIYLSGSIMGFSKTDMKEKIEDIIAFADIGDFIYQPVKIYSSGMYVRLAFAVAINVNLDILIIDEALAVGDAKFQLKCFRQLEHLKEIRTTIIFVTHSPDQVKSLCSKGALLNDGQLLYLGDPKETVVRYFDLLFPKEADGTVNMIDRLEIQNDDSGQMPEESFIFEILPEKVDGLRSFGKGGAVIDWIKIAGMKQKDIFEGGEDVTIYIKCSWEQNVLKTFQEEYGLIGNIGIGIALADSKGTYIFGCSSFDGGPFIDYARTNEIVVKFNMTFPYLRSGAYFIHAAVALGNQQNHVQLKWYDLFHQLECVSIKKNVYGVCHLDYKTSILGDGPG